MVSKGAAGDWAYTIVLGESSDEYAMMRFSFGYKFLLLASLPTGCAWAIPVISPLVSKHQQLVYADAPYHDTTIPDMYSHRNDVLYEAAYRHTRSPLVANVNNLPLRFRTANRITTVQNDEASAGATTLVRCEVFSPCPEGVGNGREAADIGANAREGSGDEKAVRLMPIRGGLEYPHRTSERLKVRQPDNPKTSEISDSSTISRVELSTRAAVKSTRIVRNAKAGQEPNWHGSKTLPHTSESVDAHLIDIEIVVNTYVIYMSEENNLAYEINVKLSAQPSNDVTVTISGHDGTKLQLNKTVLTFTSSNWEDDQTVELTTAHDSDSFDEDFTLTFSGSGTAPDNILEQSIRVLILDDENVYVVITPSSSEDSPHTVDEGGREPFTFSRLRAYESSVTVRLGDSSVLSLEEGQDSCFELDDTTPSKTVTLVVGSDSDALDETASLHLIAGLDGREKICGSTGLSLLETRPHDIWLKIDDDEEFELVIQPIAIEVIEEDPVGEIFTVRLSEQPRNDVTVDIHKETGSELNLDKTQLEFTSVTWNTDQEVKVTANADEDDLTREMETLTLVTSGEDFSEADTTVSVTIIEADELSLEAPAEITIVEGESRTFTVSLSHRTSEEVTVGIVSSEGSNTELEFPSQLTFPPNTKSQTVTVTAEEDVDNLTGEIETLTLTATNGDYDGIMATIRVTITDKDLELVVEPTAITVTEEDPAGAFFNVSLSHTPSSTVTVNIVTETNSNLILSGTGPNTALTFDAANTPQTVTVTAGSDNNSLDETQTITLTADENYARKTARVTVTVVDAQDPELVIVPTTISVPEGGGETFTVALSERPLSTVTVDIGGESGSDLTLDLTSLTFTTDDWNVPQPVNVTAGHDEDAENDEVTLTLLARGGGYTGVSDNVTVTIEDDDIASLIISPTQLTIPEEESRTFTVNLSRPPSSSVTVNITPRTGAELTVSPSAITFTAVNWNSPNIGTVIVTALDDSDAFDNHEKLDLTAFGGGFDGTEDSVAVTIIDDETLSLIAIPDSIFVNEGEENIFSIILSERPLGDVTVNTGSDPELTLAPAELDFPQDEWNLLQSVTVVANHDGGGGPIEEVKTLTLVAEDGGYDGVQGDVTVTVLDDDLGLEVPTEITVIEGTTVFVEVALSHTPSAPVTVDLLRIFPQSADESELILEEEPLTFTTEQVPQTIAITAVGDQDVFDEHEETLQFRASGGGYDGIVSDLLVHIENPDPPRLIIDPVTINLEEGDEEGEIFTVQLSHEPLSEVTVDISGDSNTDLDLDRTVLMFTTENWNDADSVTVKANDDPDDEDEMVELMLTASGGGYTGKEGSVLVTIDDDESFQLRVLGESVAENEGPLTFTVTLETPNLTQDTRVRYATMDGSAVASLDYREQSDVLEFRMGETTKTVDVEIIDDLTPEPEKSFMLVLSDPENAKVAVDRATGVIFDDDIPAHVNLEHATQEVSEGDGVKRFRVTLEGTPVPETVVVMFGIIQGTAVLGQDYRVQTIGPLRFPPGTREQSIDIEIIDDEIQETNETFTIALTSVEHAGIGIGTSTVTIVDDDEASLSINDVRAKESSGEAIFTVSLSNPSSTQITVNYSTENGTALAGQDYTTVGGTLRFSENDANLIRTIRVPLVDNDEDEPDETFVVRLSGVVGAVIENDEGIGTIEDDEPPITISIYNGLAHEDAGSLEMAARLSRASSQKTVTVRFSSSDKTATSSADYTATTGLLIFERGSTDGKVLIEVIDDQIVEGDETFEVMLSNPRNAVIGQAQATGTIVENEQIPQLLTPNISVLESEGVAVFVMTLSIPSTVPVIVNYETEDGSAVAGTDYVQTAGTLTFTPSEVEKEVRVELLQDGQEWRAETFSLILGPVLNAELSSTRVQATIAEETTVEEGALNAYVSRMLRTTASHVVEAIVDRPQRVPECRLPNLSFLRYGYPNWNPSAGELLSGCGAQATQGGWSVWGRGTFTRVLGKEGALSISSNVTTMALGTDYQWTNRLLAGLLASHSIGNGSYEAYDDSGDASSALTGIYPYLSYQLPTVRVWLLAGLGRGNAKVESLETNLTSGLVALGATGTLASRSRVHLSYAVDAFVASASPAQFSTINVRRLRASLTGSVSIHQWVRPYVEAAIRHDAGDAETGLGLELGGGTRLAYPESWLRAEIDFRRMIMHAADGFQQWGASASIQYGNPQGIGPTAQVRPIWGQTARRDFWSHDALTNIAQTPGARRMDIELGYGTRSNEWRLVRPSLGTTLHPRGRDYRIGYSISMTNGLMLSLVTTARESTTDRQPLSYGVNGRASLRW